MEDESTSYYDEDGDNNSQYDASYYDEPVRKVPEESSEVFVEGNPNNILERTYSEAMSQGTEETDFDPHEAVVEFKKVLKQGIYLTQHSGDHNPQILFAVHNNVIQYSGGIALKSGSRRFHFENLAFVGVGKRTEGFLTSSSASDVDEDLCFSLVIPGNYPFSSNDSLDLEASSALEREALVYGVSLLLEDSKNPSVPPKRKQNHTVTHHMSLGHDFSGDEESGSWFDALVCW